MHSAPPDEYTGHWKGYPNRVWGSAQVVCLNTSVEYAARRPSVQRTDLETTGSLCLRCPPAATDAHGRPPGAGGGAEEGGCALCKPSQGSVDRPALLTVSGRGLGKRRCQAVPQRFPKAHVCFPRTKHRPALAADSWGM